MAVRSPAGADPRGPVEIAGPARSDCGSAGASPSLPVPEFRRRISGQALRTLLLVALTTTNSGVFAGDWCPLSQPDTTACDDCTVAEAHQFGTRTQLTGDWGGLRTGLGESGISVDADSTMFYMGVVGGGVDREFRFAGHNDYVVNLDAQKLGGPKGLFVKLRAEHRFGESMAGATGALLSSNVVADLPVADSREIYLTDVLFTQMLSESFGVFFGKMNTFDGDANAYAQGRGKTQFSNVAMVITPLGFRTVVYSTLGAGFVILRDGESLFSFSVLNATDSTKTSGFEELFNEGVVLASELRLPTEFFGLPGHQLFGGIWSSRSYAALDQDPRIILPRVPIAEQSGSWTVYWNFDQAIYVDPRNKERTWGAFGRAGVADADTNLVQWFLSFGVGGSSLLPGREADTFGAGWYYSGTSSELAPFVAGALGGIGDGQGAELYYDMALTPAIHVTPDLQVIVPARDTVDTAVVLGMRARMVF